tara:strand:+ start:2070 stop:2549 length:480 start_codon:yes stop_codon:yes gene_type:complete
MLYNKSLKKDSSRLARVPSSLSIASLNSLLNEALAVKRNFMLYLFLGNVIVGLFILLGIPIEDKLSTGQYIFLIAFSICLDFPPTLGYVLGRRLSKTTKIHWETLLFLGVVVGLFTQVVLPELGFGVSEDSSLWYVSALLFFAVAFIPPKIEKWRFKTA